MTTFQADVEAVCAMARAGSTDSGRTVIGIAGPPASGKSTLAEAVVTALNDAAKGDVPLAALVPMDGYHLDNAILKAKGLFDRKGAPETFDAHGFCAALGRLRDQSHELFFPRFDRGIDMSVAGALSIHPQTPIVVVEGNYLLLESAPWSSLKDLFSATVFVSPAREVLRARLLQRWIDHGHSPEAALQRASGNDLPNAERILDESVAADLILHQSDLD
ncbi:nucleoside triphosphate hydrolase [Pacificibacter marinus]|uniref:nucleoside triphosphate hydrolase n=1 Tax=Pacificibacter marinus TaxID=658057 RepID=UPI002090A696|nr:nucleoside triphosphate hydrolase [Pacificibacter marinus]